MPATPWAVLPFARRRATATPNPDHLITDYVPDAAGQIVQTIDPRGITQSTTYDSRGRVTNQFEA